MVPLVVPAYAAVLALLYVVLALRVIRMRQSERVAIGTGGNARLERAMRVHANFAEYVPLALLLVAFLEPQGSPAWLLHALCVVLVAARVMHAYGVSQERENFSLRTAGMAATFAVLLAASLALLGRAMGY